MNAPAQIKATNEDENALAVLEQVDNDPKLILLGKADHKTYMAQLRASVAIVEGDIDTKAGRDRIKSAAQSIRTRKAEIDRTRKVLTEHWRKQTAAVNEAGKVVIADLDALIDEVRAPVTAWEKAEEARKAEADRIIQDLTFSTNIMFGETVADVQERLDRIRGMNLNPEILGIRLNMAEDLKAEAVAKLTEAVAGLKAQEAQAAELERLRAEQAAAEQRRIAEEQERAAVAAREAASKAEAERLERAKAEAAEQAKREAEQAAERERIERDRAAQAEIDAANARAAEAERLADMERQRIEAERDMEAKAREVAAAEQARREADIAHREQIIDAAAEAIVKLGLTKKLATAVVNAIASGNVPAVQVVF
jgi:colicin import membrane protein